MRTGILEVGNITDPLLAHQFDLFISNIPVGDGRTLATKIETANIPSYGNEAVLVTLHGVTRPFAGRGVYEHDFPCTFMESRDLIVHDTILAWLELIRSVRNTTGSFSSEYTAQADLVLYDDKNNAIRTIRLFGFYPEKKDQAALNGTQGSEVVKFNCNFKFFYFSDIA